MSKQTGACATQNPLWRRHWWQRYPMFGLVAGWVLIGVVMAAGASQLHLLSATGV